MSPVSAHSILSEAEKRRTFAIISHPDAGKTTLTEKLLLYGGAIREAGAVKARKASRGVTSDWMAIEQERGISVTSSVLRFEKDGIQYNLLDTPGHKDFSEDTLRTLVAADCALMVIDVAKGVEEQTEKLYQVCKLRRIPIITFVNKCDRPGLAPLEVLSDIENKLGLRAVAATWPIGYGQGFEGVYDIRAGELHRYAKVEHGARRADAEILPLAEGLAKCHLNASDRADTEDVLSLIEGDFVGMDREAFATGGVTPVFFGSALNNFGLDLFLEHFRHLAPSPRTYPADSGQARALDEPFSGFIFKLQANMNPDHRDCTAFVRVASGVFRKGMEVTVSNLGKKIKLATPHSLMGDERAAIETAYPGDILALFNPGGFRIGGTLYEKQPVRYDVIPLFSPEHFMKAQAKDPMKRKAFRDGLQQLSEEGVVHVFEVPGGVGNELLLGTVGALQFEVVQHRMAAEYNVQILLSGVPYFTARWLPKDDAVIAKLSRAYSTHVTYDMDGNPIVLFDSQYALNQAVEAVGAQQLYVYKTG